MGTARILTIAAPVTGERPRDNELDLYGLTHPGKVRSENQDHFLLCTVHQQMVVHATSLPGPDNLPLRGERLGTIMLVADGVGGSIAGGEASQLAAESITRYVSRTMRCFHASSASEDKEFVEALRSAALDAHNAVRAESGERGAGEKRMATTLTLAIAVWPRMYVVQVGDSRLYYYGEGKLRQVTRDQTVAQYLIDVGAMPPDRAARSPYSNILASAIGGEEAKPEVSRLDIPRGCVVLLCTDGLTKHVSDEEIAEHLANMEGSERVCHDLLDLAMERGGSDNITILVGRARPAGRPSK
ncbi:MAG: protein phosphatase 2C domain-containing protein [Gemmatimonadota bacterium]